MVCSDGLTSLKVTDTRDLSSACESPALLPVDRVLDQQIPNEIGYAAVEVSLLQRNPQ